MIWCHWKIRWGYSRHVARTQRTRGYLVGCWHIKVIGASSLFIPLKLSQNMTCNTSGQIAGHHTSATTKLHVLVHVHYMVMSFVASWLPLWQANVTVNNFSYDHLIDWLLQALHVHVVALWQPLLVCVSGASTVCTQTGVKGQSSEGSEG